MVDALDIPDSLQRKDNVHTPSRSFGRADYGELVGNHDVHPLAPIRKEKSQTAQGNVTGYGVEIYDPKDEDDWNLVGSVGREYLLVPNDQVVEAALDIAEQSSYDFTPHKLFWDDRRMVFSLITGDAGASAEVAEVGDTIGLGMMFQNSYNGSMSYRATLFGQRLICGNGMVSKNLFSTYTFRHKISAGAGWREDQERALAVLEGGVPSLQQLADGLGTLQGTGTLEMADLQRIRREALPDLSVTRWGQILDEFVGADGSSDEGGTNLTGYGLMNAGTRTLWHRDRVVSDYNNNQYFVDGLLDFAEHRLN